MGDIPWVGEAEYVGRILTQFPPSLSPSFSFLLSDVSAKILNDADPQTKL